MCDPYAPYDVVHKRYCAIDISRTRAYAKRAQLQTINILWFVTIA